MIVLIYNKKKCSPTNLKVDVCEYTRTYTHTEVMIIEFYLCNSIHSS